MISPLMKRSEGDPPRLHNLIPVYVSGVVRPIAVRPTTIPTTTVVEIHPHTSPGASSQMITPTPDTEMSSLDIHTAISRRIRSENSIITLQPDDFNIIETQTEEVPRKSAAERFREMFVCCGITCFYWLPMMCSCVNRTEPSGHPAPRGSYERLGSASMLLELGRLHRDQDKQDELIFYNEDLTYRSVAVEKNLCAIDLCQLLALKNRVRRDVTWSIVETWVDLGLERCLEDNEDVLSVHKDMESFRSSGAKRFMFRKDFHKYQFFREHNFFPSEMLDLESSELRGSLPDTKNPVRKMLSLNGECPTVFSSAWIRDPDQYVWVKTQMILRGRKLYVRPLIPGETPKRPGSSDSSRLQILARVTDYEIYWALDARRQFQSPTEWVICLRPVTKANTTGSLTNGLRCIALDNERTRVCWVTAMRLAKYGKQLRENYRAFKNKQCEAAAAHRDYNSYTLPSESIRSRVAMDFTGSVGRIVDDPKEAKAIAAAEGTSWKRRWRPTTRPPPDRNPIKVEGMQSSVHLSQPWFHRRMGRERAAALVIKHGSVDGVFLVRESRSNPGAFVLTYKSGGKVLHTQIQPTMDRVRDSYCYSLDNGVTKFYDLLQLVEFYQLNAGCLPTRLTHYVVESPSSSPVQEEASGSASATPSLTPAVTPTPMLTTTTSVTTTKPLNTSISATPTKPVTPTRTVTPTTSATSSRAVTPTTTAVTPTTPTTVTSILTATTSMAITIKPPSF